MLWILVVAVVVLALMALVNLKGGTSEGFPYVKKEALFSPAERSFLGVLDQAVGSEYRIFGQVSVKQVIEPHKGLDKSKHQIALNKIQQKVFDFVLCSRDTLTVRCLVELNDQSHKRRNRRERDSFLTGACDAASLPLLHFSAKEAYSVAGVRDRILAALRQESGGSSRLEPSLSLPSAAGPSVGRKEPALGLPETGVPSCPKCSSPMVRRRAKAGENAGREFWGCSTYPRCRAIL